jgi:hypothetical protein
MGLVVGTTAAAFAYTADWFNPDRLTPDSASVAVIRLGIVATIPRVSASPDTLGPMVPASGYPLRRCLARGWRSASLTGC